MSDRNTYHTTLALSVISLRREIAAILAFGKSLGAVTPIRAEDWIKEYAVMAVSRPLPSFCCFLISPREGFGGSRQ